MRFIIVLSLLALPVFAIETWGLIEIPEWLELPDRYCEVLEK